MLLNIRRYFSCISLVVLCSSSLVGMPFGSSRVVIGDSDVKLQNASFDAQAGPSMPFGGGIRGCFGRRLAYVEMRTFLITILWTFELLKCPDELSGYEAYDGVVHKPANCYVRLRNAPLS